MSEQVNEAREAPVHRWLFAVAIGLMALLVPHAAWVMVERLPGALFTMHAVATGCMCVYAELRRQEWKRCRVREDLSELVAAAERR